MVSRDEGAVLVVGPGDEALVGIGDRPKCGMDWDLEARADALLKGSRAGLTRVSDKQDFLTADQLDRRRSREVYSQNGVADLQLYSGLFRRAWNPNANKRPRHNPQEE